MVPGWVLDPVTSTIIAFALVPIGAALGAPPSRTAWLVSALYPATALGRPAHRPVRPPAAVPRLHPPAGTLAPGLGVLDRRAGAARFARVPATRPPWPCCAARPFTPGRTVRPGR
ncbi:hypothetical protein GCM10010238_40130 [Streptomyces griseoviridis]|uniref:Uncharacterized protein n=1 Tax=Streptomyces griseoviridis TaxID=45398 RepID=A0A918LGC6_STRGD|nr:hypothetical protein GCM10010238_40130 [Streptomyces niveoruber]